MELVRLRFVTLEFEFRTTPSGVGGGGGAPRLSPIHTPPRSKEFLLFGTVLRTTRDLPLQPPILFPSYRRLLTSMSLERYTLGSKYALGSTLDTVCNRVPPPRFSNRPNLRTLPAPLFRARPGGSSR